MADTRNAEILAFRGMENSIMELRNVAMLCARMENELSGETRPDGTFHAIYESGLEANCHAFLVYDLERRIEALYGEFNACCRLGFKEPANG